MQTCSSGAVPQGHRSTDLEIILHCLLVLFKKTALDLARAALTLPPAA
jgi:hypothetical protein